MIAQKLIDKVFSKFFKIESEKDYYVLWVYTLPDGWHMVHLWKEGKYLELAKGKDKTTCWQLTKAQAESIKTRLAWQMYNELVKH